MTSWAIAKYVLALGGLALVILADRVHRSWVGYAGLGLLVAAFALRFVQRRYATPRNDSAPNP